MYWSIGNQYPIVSVFTRRGVQLRLGVAIEIPGRIDECVHGVGLAAGSATALRTLHVNELRHTSNGEPPARVMSTLPGNNTGRSFSGTGTMPSRRAVDHWDRRAPVALAEMPQSFRRKVTVALPKPFSSANFSHLTDRVLAGHAAIVAGVHQQLLVSTKGRIGSFGSPSGHRPRAADR